ncbi:stage II sporulation protein R [Paenibacillus sp. MBLB4367]|uniref:stage II sporulation protein R n=1 Tax=Paenibacillus sp. MBLB4367 TaxID=3384767 RepID=UPI003907F92E
MVKRVSLRQYAYVIFAMLVMIACWETNKSNAAVVGSDIPSEAIRLRILANSDAVQDQAIKRVIRDAIIAEMDKWVSEPQGIDEARQIVRDHLPELGALVGKQLEEHGYAYGYSVELGIVPFPTKMYGNRIYPAGEYEALRVTLGKGEGQNWWCVLFPPLCFVDAASGEAVAKDKDTADVRQTANTAKPVQTSVKAPKEDNKRSGSAESLSKQNAKDKETKLETSAKGTKVVVSASGTQKTVEADQLGERPAMKFFIWEKIKSIFSAIKGWFS